MMVGDNSRKKITHCVNKVGPSLLEGSSNSREA